MTNEIEQDLTVEKMREILRARLGPNALYRDIYMRVHDDCYFYVPALEKKDGNVDKPNECG